MIKAIGIDSVEIVRFDAWKSYSHASLLRIFSQSELAYSLSNPIKTTERFAARFAAKEASYKALSALLPKKISFLTWCKQVEVMHDLCSKPMLKTTSEYIEYTLHLSITHTKTIATAVVIIE